MFGVVLSGGAARGAYEAGVLSVVLEVLAEVGGRPDVVCGTSVGAVHASLLASVVDDPGSAQGTLEQAWTSLSLDRALPLMVGATFRTLRVWTGGRPAGLFRTEPLLGDLAEQIDFARARVNIDRGVLSALTVSTTEVPTGRPVLFVDRHPDTALPSHVGRDVDVRDARIGPGHVVASAAVPLFFAPVEIDGVLHADGGLRQDTPIGPALRMGADRLLVISVSSPSEARAHVELPPGRGPGAPFLLGKVLDVFLLDHLERDLHEIDRINAIIRDGVAACGPDFGARVGAISEAHGGPAYRVVEPVVVRPTEDLSAIAAERVASLRLRPTGSVLRPLLHLMDRTEGGAGNLASWLLFDGEYAGRLFELGRRDGHAVSERIAALVRSEPAER